MTWTVNLKESVIDDLRWFGKKQSRKLLDDIDSRLSRDPLEESRNVKTLQPNPIAERELRLHGKYRVLFNVDEPAQLVTVVLVGEKRKNSLFIQGKEYTAHEGHSP